MSRNKCFFFPALNITCFTFYSICDLFTDSPSCIYRPRGMQYGMLSFTRIASTNNVMEQGRIVDDS
jgi:hypothetical protein